MWNTAIQETILNHFWIFVPHMLVSCRHFHLIILKYSSSSPSPPSILDFTTFSFLSKNTVPGFRYGSVTKWFYSQCWKWLNLTTIVFYDNLCFQIPSLLSYHQLWLLPYSPPLAPLPPPCGCCSQTGAVPDPCTDWKQILLPGVHFNGQHASLKSPEP